MSTWLSPEKTALQQLIGRRVEALLIDGGQQRLVFVCHGLTVLWTVVGDCCSESWFADIVDVDHLFSAEVTAIAVVPLPAWVNTDDGRGRQETDEAYGYRVTTERGYVDIIFRNSSNGYYGGWMEPTIIDQVPSEMKEIRSDWHA